jgi:FkbM family methyltransferase
MGRLKRVAKGALQPVLGVGRFQKMWDGAERLSLQGLHVGSGAEVAASGEAAFLEAFVTAHAFMGRNLVCVDAGANEGLWSETLLRRSRIAECPVTIIAFEPSSTARSLLRQRLGGAGAVAIEGLALGAHSGRGVLRSDSEGSGLACLYPRRLDHFGISLHVAEDVEITTLDEYCAGHDVTRIDLLKLDVEGAELDVLQGATGLLEAGGIGTIQWEFGGCNIDSRTFFQDFWYLLHDHYDIYRMLSDGLWPIDRYEERYERFVTTNLVAISRQGRMRSH